MASTCNYPRKERIYAGAFLFQKIRTQCPKSAIRTGCKVGGKSARLYLDNFTAAAGEIPAATDSAAMIRAHPLLNPCTALTVITPLWESVEPYGMAVLTYPRPCGRDIKILRRSNAYGQVCNNQTKAEGGHPCKS